LATRSRVPEPEFLAMPPQVADTEAARRRARGAAGFCALGRGGRNGTCGCASARSAHRVVGKRRMRWPFVAAAQPGELRAFADGRCALAAPRGRGIPLVVSREL